MESTEDVRAKFGRFRILVIGRANAGKTTLLQRVCNTTEKPKIFDREGKQVSSTFHGTSGSPADKIAIRSMLMQWSHQSMYVCTHWRTVLGKLMIHISVGTTTSKMNWCSEATQILSFMTHADLKPEVKMNSRRWRNSFRSARLQLIWRSGSMLSGRQSSTSCFAWY